MKKAKKHFNVKRLLTILLIAFFVAIMTASFALLTTIRKVEVTFSVLDNTDTSAVQSAAEEYVGSNYFSFNEEELRISLEKFSYVEVLSIKKSFPNIITVSVKERREIYSVETDDEVLIISEDGYLLRTCEKTDYKQTREIIKLNFGKLEIVQKKLGQVLKTDNNELFVSVLKMAKSVNLANCIKEISIIKYDAVGELSDVEFVTYTGVRICVYKAEEMGVEKIQRAFEVYDINVSDYEKASDTLYAFYNQETGNIEVAWSDRSVGEE